MGFMGGYNNPLSGGMRAIDVTSPEGSVEFAFMVLELAEKKYPGEARKTAEGVRNAMLSLATALALISQAQNQDDPVFVSGKLSDSEDFKYSPAEVLKFLGESFERDDLIEAWGICCELFCSKVNYLRAQDAIAEMPEDFTVDDILGESAE